MRWSPSSPHPHPAPPEGRDQARRPRAAVRRLHREDTRHTVPAVYRAVPHRWVAASAVLVTALVAALAYTAGQDPAGYAAWLAAGFTAVHLGLHFPRAASSIAVLAAATPFVAPTAGLLLGAAQTAAVAPVFAQVGLVAAALLAAATSLRWSVSRPALTLAVALASIPTLGALAVWLCPWPTIAVALLPPAVVLFARSPAPRRLTLALRAAKTRRSGDTAGEPGGPGGPGGPGNLSPQEVTSALLGELPGVYATVRDVDTGAGILDHAVIGPHGVTTITSYHLEGAITLEVGRGLLHNGTPIGGLLAHAVDLAAPLSHLLPRAAGTVVVLHGAHLPTSPMDVRLSGGERTAERVTLTEPRHLPGLLRAPGPALSRRVARDVLKALRELTPPHRPPTVSATDGRKSPAVPGGCRRYRRT